MSAPRRPPRPRGDGDLAGVAVHDHIGPGIDAGQALGLLNIGGISNLTVLRADGSQLGFDCGPGNALMDGWCARHLGQAYDDRGAWAASGTVQAPLLAGFHNDRFCADAFKQLPPQALGHHAARRGFQRDSDGR